MIIDFHVHISHVDDYLDPLIKNMDLVGIDRAVIFSRNSDVTAEALEMRPERLSGFSFLNPTKGERAVEELERDIGKRGFCGLKLGPSVDSFYPNDEKVYPIYAKAQDLQIPVLFHTGTVYRDPKNPGKTKVKYSQPIYLDDVARDFPELILIAAHSGRPFLEQMIAVSHLPNVYVDIAWSQLPLDFYEETVRKMLLAFGPDRIIYGSDTGTRHDSYGADVDRVIKMFKETTNLLNNVIGLDHNSVAKIMGGNASRLLKKTTG